MSEYVALRLGSYTIHHGYDDNNKPIEEYVKVDDFSEKIVKLDRVLSFTEKTVLISSGFNREIYWEYEGGLETIKRSLLDKLIPT